MVDPIAKVPAPVLAAALRDVAGVVIDVATPSGQAEAAREVQRLMSEKVTAEQLLDSLERHGAAETLRHDLRMTYGPVALAENCLASDGWNEEPPVGSADFEAFVTNEGRQNADSAELVTPRTLGFEEEHVEPLWPDRLHGEEIDGKQTVPMRSDELAPGRARGRPDWSEATCPQPCAHGRRRHRDAESFELANDALIPPARVFSRKPQDQLPNFGTDRRPAGTT